MKVLLYLGLIFICIALYLYQSYAHFFNQIGEYNLPSPFQQSDILITTEKNNTRLLKILFLGDSLTAGVGTDSVEETYSYNYAKLESKDLNIQLYNLGFPSAKVKDLLPKVQEIRQINPEKIFIFIGINDLFNRTKISEFSSTYSSLINQLKTEQNTLILVNIPYLGSPKSVPFPYNLLLDLQLKRYNTAIKTIAEDEKVELIDLYTLSHNQFKTDPALYAKDQFHPSAKGYILISDLIHQHAANNPKP